MRPLLASAAIAAAIALAGCDTDGTPTLNGRHMQPISDRMLADFEQKNMAKESAILVRIFKEESELEVWKQDRNGQFALLKIFPICRWSGDLGPKIKQGDRQAPEGFYTITPGQMNPNSNYYLAINTGFPNAYDRSHGRTGDFLMIHGDCSSRGCYAMTDEQIAEIYALARESFFGGQKAFQIQAYPFRMTPKNMARHRNSPHMAFWRMLKQGYDHFEVTRQEPKVDICERRYVFNAESNGRFSASDRCPAYRVPEEIASAVRDKQRRDDIQTAEIINRGAPTAASRAGVDGGMNKVFLAAIRKKSDFVDSDGRIAAFNPPPKVPGTIPAHVNPPRDVPADTGGSTGSIFSLASFESKPAPAPEKVQVASAAPTESSGGFLGNLFSSFGSRQEEPARAPAAEAAKPKANAKPTQKPAARPTATASVIPARKPQAEPQDTNTRSASAAAVRPQPSQATAAAQPQSSSLLSGAAPTVQANAFDNRFGGWR
jgi:murein L,D-transpeptidase YafK